MTAKLGNSPIDHYGNPIRIVRGVQPMRDRDDRTT
jgi:hypothetical protein